MSAGEQIESGADERFEIVLAHVLRAGVFASAAVVALGGALWLASHGFERQAYARFHGEPAALRSVAGILAQARRFQPAALIQLGLLLLIATPIARVVFSVVGFCRQRDWLYVTITLLVLGLLAYSLVSG